MRHADISTTMKYFAGQDVAAMEDAAYAAFGRINSFVSSPAEASDDSQAAESEALAAE